MNVSSGRVPDPPPGMRPAPLVSSDPQLLSYRKIILLALAAAVIVFLISAGLDWLLVYAHESRSAIIEASDAMGGIIAGALVFRLLQYERERRRIIRNRLETIADMNHHIRNALQVISGTAYSTADQQQLTAIRESVSRIQWALREILPKL
jgi:signal transduction histidine kinase